MALYIKSLPRSRLEFQMFVLDELADDLARKGRDVIKVTIGISELVVPEPVQVALQRAMLDFDKTHVVYPEGVPDLRSAIADYYYEQFNVEVSAGDVIVNVGTSAIFRNLFQLLCQPGQQILLPRPYYCLYLLSSILAEAEQSYYDIDCRTKRLDLDSFRRAYDPDRTAIVVLNSPGNPLGNVLSREEILGINEIVDGRSWIINDEIYNNVMFQGVYTSPLTYLDERHRRVNIVTNGFSKGFRLYTKRVGYAILPEPLLAPLRIVQQHTLLTADPATQYAMVEALSQLEAPRELCRLYKARADYAVSALRRCSDCHAIEPEGGFYIVLDCAKWMQGGEFASSHELARNILEKVAVATVPGSDFGLPQALRLSFCNARFNEAIDRLVSYFSTGD